MQGKSFLFRSKWKNLVDLLCINNGFSLGEKGMKPFCVFNEKMKTFGKINQK